MKRMVALVRMKEAVLLLVSLAMAVLLAGGAALLGAAGPAGAASSPEDGKILFVSSEQGPSAPPHELQTMDPDGSNRVSFSPTISNAYAPEWSPDGTKFAYVSNSGGIVVSSADGTERTTIPNTNINFIQQLSWSPDGTKIAFDAATVVERRDPDTGVRYDVGSSDIYTVNIDGSNLTNLRNGVPPEKGFYWPTWSPDGSKVAFVYWEEPHGSFPGTQQEIYTVSADGTGQLSALPTPAYGAMPEWSPDGSKIAFIAFDSIAADGVYGWDVNVMNADGGEQRKVTNDGGEDGFFVTAVQERDPDWSPDGTKIAFSGSFRVDPCTNFCGQTDIFTIGIDGSEHTNITDTNEANEVLPSWGPVAAPTDTTAPKVKATNPANGTKDVRRGTNLRATFSEHMDPASIDESTFKLFRCPSTTSNNCTTQVTNVTVRLSTDGLRTILNPFGSESTTLLAKKTRYKAVVTTGATDVAGNALDQIPSRDGNQQKVWYFTTGRT